MTKTSVLLDFYSYSTMEVKFKKLIDTSRSCGMLPYIYIYICKDNHLSNCSIIFYYNCTVYTDVLEYSDGVG
jgi:hypothetical protein